MWGKTEYNAVVQIQISVTDTSQDTTPAAPDLPYELINVDRCGAHASLYFP